MSPKGHGIDVKWAKQPGLVEDRADHLDYESLDDEVSHVGSGPDGKKRREKVVKETELFDRWKSLQICKWEMNMTEANSLKLSRCCNAPSFLFTTQKNTPLGTKLRYEVDTSGIFQISPEIFKIFPKDMPYYRSQFKKCAVVGNGGILKNSKCGKEIDNADFVFRCNLPPISDKYVADVGIKTDVYKKVHTLKQSDSKLVKTKELSKDTRNKIPTPGLNLQ
ncbi:unnamed protein product [Ranitomeya imitator]|uniref:Uncharacterized protein n=1 Tax=Ranitomeya imitator TaxID=111125 RepID=A0ABN9M7L5_9NEOB|nr:unnamed protein product [Ranitomeya imitator]